MLSREAERQATLVALVTSLRRLGQYGGYRYTQPRDLNRDREALKRDLAIAYVQHRRQDWRDDSRIQSCRRGNVIEMRRRA